MQAFDTFRICRQLSQISLNNTYDLSNYWLLCSNNVSSVVYVEEFLKPRVFKRIVKRPMTALQSYKIYLNPFVSIILEASLCHKFNYVIFLGKKCFGLLFLNFDLLTSRAGGNVITQLTGKRQNVPGEIEYWSLINSTLVMTGFQSHISQINWGNPSKPHIRLVILTMTYQY